MRCKKQNRTLTEALYVFDVKLDGRGRVFN